MVSPLNLFVRALLIGENYLVSQILRRPEFHHMVRGIHRRVQDHKYGRDPQDPLRPGEATGTPPTPPPFLKYFAEEIRNQFRGSPTDTQPSSPPAKRK
ncbi:hypothetical protein BD289DRAFT_489148 [Coniella lustricola]|uniref:Uncharacterized protein n=1 Tax=Coniella lustricola TaxID=2025994 RepID=A0A2T3A2L2_9PEZI|nr:hypothetical protein BD289DRAFT_489148 [Coniella lustricola]